MLISTLPPPIEMSGVADVSELCSRREGLGFLPAVMAAGAVLGPVSNLASSWVTAKSNENIAKQQAKIEALQAKGEKEDAAREFAVLQAMKQIEPHEKARNQQLYALYAVGGVATVISLYMLVQMARSRGK